MQRRSASWGREPAVDVAAWMRAFAAQRPLATERPNPGHLWFKAQVLRQWDARRRVTTPLDVAELVQVAVSAVIIALLMPWLWRAMSISTTVWVYVLAAAGGSGALLSLAAAMMFRQRLRGE